MATLSVHLTHAGGAVTTAELDELTPKHAWLKFAGGAGERKLTLKTGRFSTLAMNRWKVDAEDLEALREQALELAQRQSNKRKKASLAK